MKNKIATHFYVKESKKDKNGEAPIYLRITVNKERAELSTNKRINPEIWDKASERVAGRTEPVRSINSTLNNLLGKVEKHFSGFDFQEIRISVTQFIAELNGKGINQMTLIQAYEYHLNNLEELSGIDFAVATVKKNYNFGYSKL